MKKVNLLSKAEMRNVMGGGYPPVAGPCLEECSASGADCKNGEANGKCTFYAASADCPDGQWACII